VKFPANEQDDYLWFSLRRSTRNIYQEDDKGQTFQYGKFYPIHTQIKEKKSCVYNHYVPNIPYMKLFGSCIGKNISNILVHLHLKEVLEVLFRHLLKEINL